MDEVLTQRDILERIEHAKGMLEQARLDHSASSMLFYMQQIAIFSSTLDELERNK
jgi:hypothetical protein